MRRAKKEMRDEASIFDLLTLCHVAGRLWSLPPRRIRLSRTTMAAFHHAGLYFDRIFSTAR